MTVSYEQARSDHEYLWSIGPAKDMTGAYVDQNDLAKLLRNPTKATARDCYVHQIEYWFNAGPDDAPKPRNLMRSDPIVAEIAERHDCN
jgi:hypothetical protein